MSLDSRSMYADLEPEERLRVALEDVREIVLRYDTLDEIQTVEVLDLVNQGLCTGRASGCGCDWCHDYEPADAVS